MNQNLYIFLMTLTAGAVTIALRAFPFFALCGKKEPPKLVRTIGGVLSPAAISMLVVYCFCSVFSSGTFASHGYAIPEILASGVVILLQLWRKNPLLSIVAGTVLYMAVIQNF